MKGFAGAGTTVPIGVGNRLEGSLD